MTDKNDLPPIGLPIKESSSWRYLLGITTATIATGALVVALGYGALQFASGPCDAIYLEAVSGLRAEVEFLKDRGAAIGVNAVEVQELRTSTRVAGEALKACCLQRQEHAISEERYLECQDQARVMARLPADLVAARNEPDAAKKAIRLASSRLRGIAGDLSDLALPPVASRDDDP